MNLFIEIVNYFMKQIFVCGSKQRPATCEQARLFIQSSLQQESATVSGVLADTQRQAEEWESFRAEAREGFGYALMEAGGVGKLQVG